MLNPTADVIELKPGGIDVAVRYRDCHRVKEDVSAILISDMIVVGAQSLLENQQCEDPSSLMDMPWLQELNTNEIMLLHHPCWRLPMSPLIISQMPGNLIMQAVRRGDGVSYTARAFFQDDIDAGRMRVLHSESEFGIYYLEINPGPSRPSVRKFLSWLKSKAETVTL